MEANLAIASPKSVLGVISPINPASLSYKQRFGLPLLSKKPIGYASNSRPRSKITLFAFSSRNSRRKVVHNNGDGKKADKVELYAGTSTRDNSRSSSSQETTSVGVNPQPYAPPPPSQIGSPLFWIGVGVGLSALFSFVASRVKQYATQQAFKTMMGQMGTQNSQFSNMNFPAGSPFNYPPPYASGPSPASSFPYPPPFSIGPSTSIGTPYQPTSTPGPSTSTASTAFSAPSQAASAPAASEASVAVDVSTTKVEAAGPEVVKNGAENKSAEKKPAFVDVSPEDTLLKSPFEDVNGLPAATASSAEIVQNGAASKEAATSKEDTTSGKRSSLLSVEALEKMMEDPTVQKMVYPHLPEEMRNPATFKWMMQNPVYRQQLQEMLDNMGGNPEWDNRMAETLKNFDLTSPEVKQQFDQLGVTPEEVITKIMSNPDLARGFQNPRVQQAMMECSQNPWNIAKYQNDKEVMDVINKLSELFPA